MPPSGSTDVVAQAAALSAKQLTELAHCRNSTLLTCSHAHPPEGLPEDGASTLLRRGRRLATISTGHFKGTADIVLVRYLSGQAEKDVKEQRELRRGFCRTCGHKGCLLTARGSAPLSSPAYVQASSGGMVCRERSVPTIRWLIYTSPASYTHTHIHTHILCDV